MLDSGPSDFEEYTSIKFYPEVDGVPSWYSGSRLGPGVAEPIRLEWDPYTGGPKLAFYKPMIPLMRKDLLVALGEAGIDNLDAYRAEICDQETGEADRNYMAVNIIGLVSAADLGGSRYADPSGTGLLDMDFDSLAIDLGKARGLKMFRLAECASGIVVHRTVRDHLKAKGGFGLVFIPPSMWIG